MKKFINLTIIVSISIINFFTISIFGVASSNPPPLTPIYVTCSEVTNWEITKSNSSIMAEDATGSVQTLQVNIPRHSANISDNAKLTTKITSLSNQHLLLRLHDDLSKRKILPKTTVAVQ